MGGGRRGEKVSRLKPRTPRALNRTSAAAANHISAAHPVHHPDTATSFPENSAHGR
jgi:hypothetical protein